MIEKLTMWIVWHLPHEIIRWSMVRGAAQASRAYSNKAMGDITIFDMMDSWRRANEIKQTTNN
jgi:hypothetical protein